MRLFIAIDFDDETKKQLWETICNLQSQSVQGSFTRHENLHLTLVFIGETDRMGDVKQALNKVNWNKFRLCMDGLGKFNRPGGDIYWLGVKKSEMLQTIYTQLCENLRQAGFPIENKEFKPHMTLGRRVMPNSSFDMDLFSKTIPELCVDVTKLSLMQSHHSGGKLIYTEIHRVWI